jgi:hypothetical protein
VSCRLARQAIEKETRQWVPKTQSYTDPEIIGGSPEFAVD